MREESALATHGVSVRVRDKNIYMSQYLLLYYGATRGFIYIIIIITIPCVFSPLFSSSSSSSFFSSFLNCSIIVYYVLMLLFVIIVLLLFFLLLLSSSISLLSFSLTTLGM